MFGFRGGGTVFVTERNGTEQYQYIRNVSILPEIVHQYAYKHIFTVYSGHFTDTINFFILYLVEINHDVEEVHEDNGLEGRRRLNLN